MLTNIAKTTVKIEATLHNEVWNSRSVLTLQSLTPPFWTHSQILHLVDCLWSWDCCCRKPWNRSLCLFPLLFPCFLSTFPSVYCMFTAYLPDTVWSFLFPGLRLGWTIQLSVLLPLLSLKYLKWCYLPLLTSFSWLHCCSFRGEGIVFWSQLSTVYPFYLSTCKENPFTHISCSFACGGLCIN